MMKSWKGPGGPGTGFYETLRRRVNDRLVRYLSEKTMLQTGQLVLEAGSGTAVGSSLFAQRFGAVSVALDLDSEALRLARRRDPSLRAVVGNLMALPFRPAAFDLAWNSSTIEHVSDPEGACLEMARVVRSNGHVFVGVPSRTGPLAFQPAIASTALGVWIGPTFSDARLTGMAAVARLVPVEQGHYFFRVFIGLLARKQAG
jgi:SAM-dependent methyltransferase